MHTVNTCRLYIMPLRKHPLDVAAYAVTRLASAGGQTC